MGMRNRLNKMKLNLAYHIRTLEKSNLAYQVMEEQIQYNWPGLATEVRSLCQSLGLENIVDDSPTMSKSLWKQLVKKAVHKLNEEELSERLENYSKLDELRKDGIWKVQDYFKELSMSEARIKFSLRTNMFPCKFNFPSDPKYKTDLWKCDSCATNIDSQNHILWCPAYKKLREGKSLENDKDLTNYFQKVLKIREKLKLRK